MVVTLRDAQPQEVLELSDLCLRSKAVWGYDPVFLDKCRDELTVTATDLATTHIVVAERDEALAGISQFVVTNDEAELLKMFVDPAALRQGVGRQLMRWALAGARRLECDRLEWKRSAST